MKKYLKSEFTKNVATLFTGTLIAQAIPVLISPILTRIYTPEDFAINEVFMRVFAIGLIFSTLRYEQAIVLPKQEDKAKLVVKLILRISVAISLVFLLFTLILGKWFADSQGNPEVYLYLFVLPIALLLSANYQSLTYWSIRNKQYKKLSFSKAGVSLANSSSRIGIGLLTAGNPIGLIGSIVVSQLTGIIMLIKDNVQLIFKGSNRDSIKEVAKEYKDFPRVNTLHALLDAGREALIIFVIITYFGDSMLGLYAFTIRLMKLPLGMIGTSVGQVFYQRAAEIVNHEASLYELTIKTLKRLIIISLPIFVLVGIFSGMVFEFVFGKDWVTAGYLAQIFAPWMFFHFINSPLSQIPLIINKQKEVFILSLVGFIVSVSVLTLCGIYLDNSLISFTIFSLTQSAYLLVVILWILNVSRKFDQQK